MKIQTPNNIDVLLHCYTCPVEHPRSSAPAVQEALEKLLDVGAITRNGGYYVTTKLGKAWVSALCNTGLPKQVFIDDAGNVIQ